TLKSPNGTSCAAGLKPQTCTSLGIDHARDEPSAERRGLQRVAPLDIFIRAPPPPAVAGRVALVHDEGIEVVIQALRRGGVAGLIELLDEGPQAFPAVALVDRLIKRLPVGLTDAL